MSLSYLVKKMTEYDENNYLKGLRLQSKEEIGELFISSLNEYAKDILDIFSIVRFKLKAESSITYTMKLWFEELISLVREVNIDNRILNKIYIFNRKYMNDLQLLIKPLEEELAFYTNVFETINNEFKRITFNHFIDNLSKNTKIIKVNIMEYIYLLSTINHKYWYVCNKVCSNARKLVDEYGIKINLNSKRKVKSYHHKNRKILLSDINKVDLKHLYLSSNYFPSFSQLKTFLDSQLRKGMDNYLFFPLFLDGRSPIFDTKSHGYINVYHEYKTFYERLISILVKNSKGYKVCILISNVLSYEEYNKWTIIIKENCFKNNNAIKLGVVFDDYELLEFMEEVPNFDVIYVKFDHLIQNSLGCEKLTKNIFLNEYILKMRIIRDVARESKSDLVIELNKVFENFILKKILIMGYKKILISQTKNMKIREIFDNYMIESTKKR